MGRQINFFLHPDDQFEFDQVIKSAGDVLFVPFRQNSQEVSTLPDSILRDEKNESSKLNLVRPSDFPRIKPEYIEKLGHWIFQDMELPVLEFSRCTFTANRINRGRIYFQPKYVREMLWVEKSPEFVSWADNIIKLARRKLKKHSIPMGEYTYQEYVGKNAALWIGKNKPKLKRGGLYIEF